MLGQNKVKLLALSAEQARLYSIHRQVRLHLGREIAYNPLVHIIRNSHRELVLTVTRTGSYLLCY
jgi:hypothetical protein